MKRILPTVLGLSLASMLACSGPVPGPNAGSSRYLYVANPDHGTMSRVDLDRHSSAQFQVGQEPTRVARRGDRVYVSNRAARTVSVFLETGETLEPIGTINTSAEPFGVAATDSKVYVSAQTAGVVEEYDAQTFARLRSFAIEGQPRGIALHPNGRTLVVASTFGGRFSVVNLISGSVTVHELPPVQGFDRFSPTGEPFELSRRITTDPVYSQDGSRFAVGGLYLDNTTPIQDPNDPMEPPPDGTDPGFPGGGGYDSGRITPVVVVTETDPEGEPVLDGAMPVGLGGTGITRTNEFTKELTFNSVSGYPADLAFADDGQLILAAIEGADAVVAVDLLDQGQGGVGAVAPAPFPGGSSIAFRSSVAISTRTAPMGLEARTESLYIHSNFDRTIERVNLDQVIKALRADQALGAPRAQDAAIALPPTLPPSEVLQTTLAAVLADRIVGVEADLGRRLFTATNNSKMSGNGAAVSCATCHFDGRTDGLTWTFTRGQRQTPSLAGNLALTNPVGWQGDRPTVAEDAMMTSQGLMGGIGLTVEDTLAIQSFVNNTRDVDLPNKGVLSEQAQRGQALFNRPDVACGTCHSGAAHTINGVVSMFGLPQVKIRHLVGISASAPYLHDGSAATLKDVLIRSRDGSMGNTASLNDAELDDLVAYLETL